MLKEAALGLVLAHASILDLPGWDKDRVGEAWPAFACSCKKINELSPDTIMAGNTTARQWQKACKRLPADADETRFRKFIETEFQAYKVQDNQPGFFTGYFEPELRGSLKKTAKYKYPIYRRPKDLIMIENLGIFREECSGIRIAGREVNGELLPFETREQLENGALKGKGLEIAWVDDPVALYFMHIQGCGVIIFENGTSLRCSYSAHNGHPYTSIGKVMVDRGILTKENVTMQNLVEWMREHPKEGQKLCATNESFVFFKVVETKSPLGAQKVPLTPGRSMAVDPRFVPLGTLLWLDAENPVHKENRLQKLMVAQDVGGAIKGPVRGDYFCGTGEKAGKLAGSMKSNGTYYLLLPKFDDD